MQIFQNQYNRLVTLKEIPFGLETHIQKIFEGNLDRITGFKLIKSEFTIKNYRIDTLAFDMESRSFIIIEYKKDRNYSVVDQGVSYLNLLLEYKADFIVEYNESQNDNLKRSDVDWSQTKVVFVSPSFTPNQIQATNFKDLAIELWEIKQFESGIVVINPIKKSKVAPSIKQVQQLVADSEIAKVAKEIIVYDEDHHLINRPDEIKEVYEAFKTAILNLSLEIEIEPKKLYIAFKKGKNIVDIQLQRKVLKLWINSKYGSIDDSKKIAKDVSNSGHWGNGDYELSVQDTKDLEYIMSLVKQIL